MLIDINDFYPVYDKVKSLSAHWRSIAISLRLRIDTIRSIKADCDGHALSCLQEVLEYWLKKDYDYKAHGVPCWRMVCVAVKEGGADPALAEEIAHEHYLSTTGGASPYETSNEQSLPVSQEVTPHQQPMSPARSDTSQARQTSMTQLLILLAISCCILPLQ